MLSFPNCKINIGLQITSKRADGYHNIATVFYPIPINDILEIIPASLTKGDIEFSASGNAIECSDNDNICVKAYHLLKEKFPQLPPVKMHLHKAIPSGAGLGGGSADGAATLLLLNNKFNLGLTQQALIDLSLQLGSDCPFFVINKPCFATGRGEILEEIELDLSAHTIVVVNPGIHINTGQAFSFIKPKALEAHDHTLIDWVQQPVHLWKDLITNDFEAVVFSQHVAVKAIKDQLYQSGALFASMSGSGSSVYGIFQGKTIPELNFPGNYYIKIIHL